MPVPTMGVTELVLEARDLEASERFYNEVLGLPVVGRWEGESFRGREAVWLQSGDQTRIGLWKPQVGIAGSRGGVHVHFAMTVTEADYDVLVAQVRERGVHVDEVYFGDDPAAPGQRSAYVTDPDGHVVEFWTRNVATQAAAGPPHAASPNVAGVDG